MELLNQVRSFCEQAKHLSLSFYSFRTTFSRGLHVAFIHLTARAGLRAIEAAGVSENGPAHLVALRVQRRRREESEDRKAFPIGTSLFSQRWSHAFPVTEPRLEALRQGKHGVHLAPAPHPLLVWTPEPCHARSQVQTHPRGLPFFLAIVASVRQHPNGEQRDWLHLLVGRRDAVLPQEQIAALLDHVLLDREACFAVFPTLLACGHRFCDGRPVLSRRSLVGFRTHEAIGEKRRDTFPCCFALGLRSVQAAHDLTFAAPLTVFLTIGRRRDMSGGCKGVEL